jgi:hypothetical protein
MPLKYLRRFKMCEQLLSKLENGVYVILGGNHLTALCTPTAFSQSIMLIDKLEPEDTARKRR